MQRANNSKPSLPAARGRLGSDDPKYGSKGRFLISAKGLLIMVICLGFCLIAYAALLKTQTK